MKGLWVTRKGDVGKLGLPGVSEASDAKRPLVLMGLTPDRAPGAELHTPAGDSAFCAVNKTSLNAGQFLLGREGAHWWTGKARADSCSPTFQKCHRS